MMLFKYKKSTLFCFLLATLFFSTGCKKSSDSNNETPPPPGNSAPVVKTSNSFSASSYMVTCGGSVVNNGGSDVTEKGICYNVSPTPTIINTKIISTDTSSNFVVTISSLSPNTTYYIRAYATNSIATTYGDQITVTTSAITANSDAGNTMYISGSTTVSNNLLFAINAKDGTTKWTKPFPNTITTPLFYNDKLYLTCNDNNLYALDTSGNIKWTFPTGQGSNGQYEPVIAGNGLVYFFAYSSSVSPAAVFAVNAETGSLVWKSAANLLSLYSGIYYRNNTVYVTNSAFLYALDGTIGNIKWQRTTSVSDNLCIFDDRIYSIAHCYLDSKDTLMVLNPATGAPIWYKKDYTFSRFATMSVKNSNIYAISPITSSSLFIADSANGDLRFPAFATNFWGPYSYLSKPVVADSILLVPFSFAYSTNVFNALTGQYLYNLPSVNSAAVECVPTVVGDVVYYRQESSFFVNPMTGGGYHASCLHAYNFRTKTFVWSKEFKDTNFAADANGVASKSGTFYRGDYLSN